jgi:Cdc6-like AAA superfamily ATPase
MVLAITGPTGTGKTEMSNLLAESLFKRVRTLPNSQKQVPTGLLIFRGEDFSDSFLNPISEYHTQIKTRLVEHLQYCSGKAIVVFDEVQKVIPHTLDGASQVVSSIVLVLVSLTVILWFVAIMEAVSDRAQLSYYKNGVTKTIDTSNVRCVS